MPIQWYCKRGEKQVGPLTSVQLYRAMREGRLLPTDSVRMEGASDWTEAAQTDGLFSVAPFPLSRAPATANKQIPNSYRLLGLQPFESDPKAITAAADKRILQLKQVQSEAQKAEAIRIGQGVVAARKCLLDPARKAGYDELLKCHLADEPASTPQEQVVKPTAPAQPYDPLAPLPDPNALPAFPEPSSAMPAPLAPRQILQPVAPKAAPAIQIAWQIPAAVGGGVLLVVVVAAFFLMSGGKKDDPAKIQTASSETAKPQTAPVATPPRPEPPKIATDAPKDKPDSTAPHAKPAADDLPWLMDDASKEKPNTQAPQEKPADEKPMPAAESKPTAPGEPTPPTPEKPAAADQPTAIAPPARPAAAAPPDPPKEPPAQPKPEAPSETPAAAPKAVAAKPLPKPQLLQTKTHAFHRSGPDYARPKGLEFDVGIGNTPDGVGVGTVGYELARIQQVDFSCKVSGQLKRSDDNSFVGLIIDYHTAEGYVKRVAVSLGIPSKNRSSTCPPWGSNSAPNQYVDLKKSRSGRLDLAEWAPPGWDGQVWVSAVIENAGRNASMSGRFSSPGLP